MLIIIIFTLLLGHSLTKETNKHCICYYDDRVAEVKRRREMPPSLADDDDDDENM